jgi:hypothetical protein
MLQLQSESDATAAAAPHLYTRRTSSEQDGVLSYQARLGLHRSRTWRVRVGGGWVLQALYADDLDWSQAHVDRNRLAAATCPSSNLAKRIR